MIDPELVSKAESVSIVDYLASKNIEPVKAAGKELLYLSPLRNEKDPSFYVNPTKNKFRDFTNEEHKGNVFRLVQLLEGCNFPQAVAKLLEFDGKPVEKYANLFLSATEIQKPIHQQTIITQPVKNPVLINYLQERKIPYSLGKKYLHEVMTTKKDRVYFLVGFPNNSGGFSLRNKYYKGCEGVQDITTFDLDSCNNVAVFEGFFDFLSALVYYGLEAPRIPTVVLEIRPATEKRRWVSCIKLKSSTVFRPWQIRRRMFFKLMRDRDAGYLWKIIQEFTKGLTISMNT